MRQKISIDMCLVCKKDTRFKRTTEEMVCYKVLQNHPFLDCFMTPYMYAKVVIGEDYSLPERYPGFGVVDPELHAEIHPYQDGDFSVNDGVFHLFKNLEPAKYLRNDLEKESRRCRLNNIEKYYIAKAIVPAGTLIIEGEYNSDCFSSISVGAKRVRYTEIVE